MSTLIEVKHRIKAVKNTQKITRAMKMVSAAKLQKAQDRILSARPYAKKMLEMLNSMVMRIDASHHPLLAIPNDDIIELVIITADKGLCGSFNTNIIKKSEDFLEERQQKDFQLNLVGKKGRNYFQKRKFKIRNQYIDIFRDLKYNDAVTIADQLIRDFTDSDTDAVYLVYNEFKSVLQQRVIVERLLPIADLDMSKGSLEFDYIFEPREEEILEILLPLHVRTQVWRAMLESSAAEHAARMNAMENATDNAAELIESLTLHMNRVRQDSITRQIIEVVSGADALKG